jgi:PPP family 3-phenylpropionic acid transporter
MVLLAGEFFDRYGITWFPWIGAAILFLLAIDTWCMREPKLERRPMVRGELRSVLVSRDVRWFLLSGFFGLWVFLLKSSSFIFKARY